MKKEKTKFRNRMLAIVGIIALVCMVMITGAVIDCPNHDLLKADAGLVTAIAAVLAGINFNERSLVELKQIRGEKYNELKAILDKCTAEKRDLNEEEISKRDAYLGALDKLDKEIAAKEALEKRNKEFAGTQMRNEQREKEQKEVASYSIIKAMRELVNGMKGEGKGLTGIELEMHQEATREAANSGISITGLGIPQIILQRDMTATGKTSADGDQGGLTIQTNKIGLIDKLRARMVLAQLGAQYLTGLTGNISIPKKSTAITAAWASSENADATESQNVFGSVSLSPKRLASFTEISKQLLIQSSLDVENMVIGDLEMAIRLAVETAAINGSGSNGQPTGILNTTDIGSVVGGDNGLAAAWSHIVNLESKVAIADADLGSLAYLTNPSVRGKLKQTSKVANQNGFIWDEGANPLNGYRAGVSTLVPKTLTKGTSEGVCSAIIFGNFNDLIIGQWAGLDLVIDPYTKAKSNMLVITVNSFWDIAVRNPESFAAMVDALTA